MLARVVLCSVPGVSPVADEAIEALADALDGRRVAVLTGAGISTESGIPDYRSEGTRRRARSPVQYADFVRSEGARRRYWARALLGWPRISEAKPNAAHHALAELESAGLFLPPITQNVDRLHQAAGSGGVIELHGALAEVECLGCRDRLSRQDVQARLQERNPRFEARPAEIAPDGDAELSEEALETFEIVSCRRCGGVLKPHVVFFGESVPRARVEAAFFRVASADTLLVLGTSLAVFSGFRFARRAAELGLPVHVVNVGETRADPISRSKLEGRLGDVVPRLAALLGSRPLRNGAPASGRARDESSHEKEGASSSAVLTARPPSPSMG